MTLTFNITEPGPFTARWCVRLSKSRITMGFSVANKIEFVTKKEWNKMSPAQMSVWCLDNLCRVTDGTKLVTHLTRGLVFEQYDMSLSHHIITAFSYNSLILYMVHKFCISTCFSIYKNVKPSTRCRCFDLAQHCISLFFCVKEQQVLCVCSNIKERANLQMSVDTCAPFIATWYLIRTRL